MTSGADMTALSPDAGDRSYNRIRQATGFALVAALFTMTIVVGVAYILVPLWAAPDVWERASKPFQTVFTAMLALTGPAIGMFMAGVRRSAT
jgi:cytochrome c-type biogenesis protein CcmH/NrfG